jgi:hypothetical protein
VESCIVSWICRRCIKRYPLFCIFLISDLGILVNSGTSMCDPPSALVIAADRQQQLQQQQQRLHHQPHHDNASTNNRRALADFYSTCEHQQRHEAAVTNSILNNTNRGDFQQQQQLRSVNRNVEKTVSSPRGSTGISSLQSAYGPLDHDNSQSHQSCDINSSFIHLQSDVVGRGGRNAVVDDLLLLRGGGGGGCDNRCELNSSSYHHHHHGHHPHSQQQQQQQQGVAISERSLVLTESRNFTLSPETTDCDSGSWLNPFFWSKTKETDNISRGPTFGDFVTILREGSCRTLQSQDYTVQEYSLHSVPLLMHCVRVSLRAVKIFLAQH